MSDRIFVGTRKGLFRLDRAGSGWQITSSTFLGVPVTMVLPDSRDGTVYVALDHGHFGAKLHRSTDGGKEFEEVSVPVYPEKPKDEEDDLALQRTPLEWKLKGVWSLEAGAGDEPGWLWCGTTPGGLFVSEDRGESWRIVRSLWDHPRRKEWFGGGTDLPAIHSICVDPRDAGTVRIAISCGGVWETTSHGETWDVIGKGMHANYMPPEKSEEPNIQDPHRMVQCRARPDCFWVQHHNGVFRSTDACQTWQDIKIDLSVFGFATVVHPDDPDTAWFVPGIKDEMRIPVDGKVVVTRTRDGGRSFDVLREGLPQEHAYDLTFRHGMDIDETGDRLAFGSSTGSMWTSDNQGDSWQHVSAHLPPVYCVRFVK